MLVITAGEPAGIGPDLMVMLAQEPIDRPCLVVADRGLLQSRANCLGLPLKFHPDLSKPRFGRGSLTVLDTPLAGSYEPGTIDLANVPGVMAGLDRAIAMVAQVPNRALVTGPMQKSAVNDAGLSFSGHTEYLASAAGVKDVVMLLVAQQLRVALATTHLALRAVPDALTPELLERRLRILHADLQSKFHVDQPQILVAGLNPHAGEQGHLGREEIEVIEPTLDKLRAEGLRLVGPLPADTLFTPQHLKGADAVMAMYHDQGLPVLKFAGFSSAVNVTLGLPFIRTSVDHGTALDKAGSGEIETGSMRAAIELAIDLVGGV